MATESLQQIIGLVAQLDQRELAVVLQTVTARIARPNEAQRSVLELQGLGRDVWSGVDVDQYIEQERDSWNG